MSEYFARSCSGKIRYSSERRATEAARDSQRKFGIEMNAYACRYCKNWHVGSTHPWDGKAARRERELEER